MNILSTMLTILLGIILAGFLAGHAAGYFDLLDWIREDGKIDDNTYSRLICSVE